MATTAFQSISNSLVYKISLAIALLVLVVAGLSAFQMEHEGHHITGMSNQIIWGMPHVLAIFLIISASGALHVASIASVFNREFYKPLARLSALLAVALLIGGLAVILLDLGRPDRLLVAMTYYNFSSIFAWNIILYTGFAGLVLLYLWTMLDWQVENYKRIAGTSAFVWRLILTAGTGSIFGVLVAREAYHIAVMGPMFIVLSLGYGLAFYLLVLCLFLPDDQFSQVSQRLSRLLLVLLACGLGFSLIYHLTNWFWADARDFEIFLLSGEGIYPWLVWGVHLALGCVLPLLLLNNKIRSANRNSISIACVLIIIGGIAQLYALIIGGQAYPMPLMEGYVASSTFFDGIVNTYSPSHWEIMLGLGGFALALIITLTGLRLFRLLPGIK